MGKFALRGLAQSMARELAPQGIHVAHFVIDGGIRARRGRAAGRPDCMLDPDAIAETYLAVLQQDRSAWTWEVEVRPVGRELLEQPATSCTALHRRSSRQTEALAVTPPAIPVAASRELAQGMSCGLVSICLTNRTSFQSSGLAVNVKPDLRADN